MVIIDEYSAILFEISIDISANVTERDNLSLSISGILQIVFPAFSKISKLVKKHEIPPFKSNTVKAVSHILLSYNDHS